MDITRSAPAVWPKPALPAVATPALPATAPAGPDDPRPRMAAPSPGYDPARVQSVGFLEPPREFVPAERVLRPYGVPMLPADKPEDAVSAAKQADPPPF